MSRPIVFVDTETNTLGHLARPWEIALIHRYAAAESGDRPADTEHVWHIEDPLPPGTNPAALALNGYYQRCGAFTGNAHTFSFAPEWEVARQVHDQLAGAVLVGVGVHFDAAVLSAMFRRHGLPEQPWPYAILDLKAATWGVFAVRTAVGVAEAQEADASNLPMRSEQLAAALGVEPPADDERHTALGDARWAARWFDALTGNTGNS